MMNFSDKHVVVTGGTGSLGSATVKKLLNNGAKVSIPCFNEAELEGLNFKNYENSFVQKGINLTNEAAATGFYENAVDHHGPLWASINIAGGFAMGNVIDTTTQDFMKQINLNLMTCFNACKAAVSHLKENGGRIANISSRPGIEPEQGAGRTAYAVSKAGVSALTQSLAAEVLNDDILVNAVAPSVIDTSQNREAMPDANFNVWPKPAEIANRLLHLCSEQNTLTSGAIIPVYGKG